jgi:hypothetical protein
MIGKEWEAASFFVESGAVGTTPFFLFCSMARAVIGVKMMRALLVGVLSLYVTIDQCILNKHYCPGFIAVCREDSEGGKPL